MSYDISLGVKVEGGNNLYAVIAEPKLSNPTYNLREMFVKCTGWNYQQGEWYKVSEVIPLIENGIHELRFNSKEYEQYKPKNGWGNISSALETLESMLECIGENSPNSNWSWNQIPLDLMYISW